MFHNTMYFGVRGGGGGGCDGRSPPTKALFIHERLNEKTIDVMFLRNGKI